MKKEYGLLYYDIPSNNQNLYQKVRRVVNKCCVPVNLSVYIFDWGFKNNLEYKLNQLNNQNKASINLVKFDPTSTQDLEKLATKQLEKIFTDMQKRIEHTISKLHNTEKRKEYLERTSRTLKNYGRLLTLYEFTKRLEPALDILKKMVSKEWELCHGELVS